HRLDRPRQRDVETVSKGDVVAWPEAARRPPVRELPRGVVLPPGDPRHRVRIIASRRIAEGQHGDLVPARLKLGEDVIQVGRRAARLRVKYSGRDENAHSYIVHRFRHLHEWGWNRGNRGMEYRKCGWNSDRAQAICPAWDP